MGKYIFNSTWILAVAVMLCALSGCIDDSDESPQGTTSSNTVCTKWGASKSEVMDYMKDYEMNAMENDGFICYDGKNEAQTISYQFQDDGLQASLLLIPEENTSLEKLKSSFGRYEYLGEKNGLDIYVSEAANTMVTIGKKTKGDDTYFAVGYVMLDDENE